jgi:hypothetical protein
MSVTAEKFYGGCAWNADASAVLHRASSRVQVFVTTAVRTCKLPNPADLRQGGPHFYIVNLETSLQSVWVLDHLGSMVKSVLPGQVGTILLA